MKFKARCSEPTWSPHGLEPYCFPSRNQRLIVHLETHRWEAVSGLACGQLRISARWRGGGGSFWSQAPPHGADGETEARSTDVVTPGHQAREKTPTLTLRAVLFPRPQNPQGLETRRRKTGPWNGSPKKPAGLGLWEKRGSWGAGRRAV